MSIFDRKPALRWLTPLAFVLVVGGTGGVLAATATADPRLPSRSAADLLVDLQKAKVDAMSGTIVQNSQLGIPDLPGVGGAGSASLTSLISGSHTLQVWYSGPDKVRLAVHGTLDESDVIRNGSNLWMWSYKDKTATHRTISKPAAANKAEPKLPADVPKTPQEAADQVLKAIDPSTAVTTDGTAKVAGRPAYELVLTPKDHGTLIRQVRIAIDSQEHIPLRVRVYGSIDKPAFEVEFSSVDFARPDDAQFAFNPPKGTKVTEVAPETGKAQAGKKPSTGQHKAGQPKAGQPKAGIPSADQPKVIGSGWATVVVSKSGANAASRSGDLGRVIKALPKVSGAWGSGSLLRGTAFSILVTDDGRVAAGAVKPELLYAALKK